MIKIEHIKKLFENTQSDILFEKITSLLPDDNDIIFEPKGLFNKGILHDTGRITKKKAKLYIEINRAGLYDILPRGLFHNKLDDLNNTPEYIEKVESEKNDIRNIFLPFDSEIFSSISKIERESVNHFSNSYDSEIAISLMDFYHLFKDLDIMSILEILFIDVVLLNQKKNKPFDASSFLKKILSKKISLFHFTANLVEATEGDSKILRFLSAIPYAPRFAGSMAEVQNLLQYILNQKVTISKVRSLKKYEAPKNNTIGGNERLNTNSRSFLLGHVLSEEVDTLKIHITIDPDNMYLNHLIKYGCIGSLIKLYLAYFVSYSIEYEVVYYIPSKKQYSSIESPFQLEPFLSDKIEKLADFRSQILNKIEKGSALKKAFQDKLEVEMNFLLIDYFSLFYEHNFKDGSKHAHLSTNTKI